MPYFEGCLPVEEMARRGRETLRFGPMKPVGLPDPRTGREPYAVVQLRREDRAGQMWNMVGFQTRLRIPEQQRVFRMLPGLGEAEFLRYGSIHRNAYLNSPATLGPALTARDDDAAVLRRTAHRRRGLHRVARHRPPGRHQPGAQARAASRSTVPPPTTMLGGLYRYLRDADPKHFQPMNANFGLLEPLAAAGRIAKDKKKELLVERAQAELASWLAEAAVSRREVAEFLTHLEKERDQSPHTVKAYRRDLEAFTEFCDRHYGGRWSWASVDRLGLRGFLGELERRGLSKRTAARSLSAVRSLYRYLQLHHGIPNPAARAAKVPKIDKRLPTYLDRATDRDPLPVGGGPRGRRRVRPDPRPGDPGAVLLHRDPALGAERDEPGGPRPAIGPGEGPGQGPEGADRAGGLARRARAAALS